LAISSLLEPSEVHLGLGDVSLGVLKVVEKSLLGPDDTFGRVRSSSFDREKDLPEFLLAAL
jgi:hypothetical protein